MLFITSYMHKYDKETDFWCGTLQVEDGEMQNIADIRCSDIYVPGWIDLVIQPQMISNPKGLKSHDWKQVSTGTTF